MANFRKMGVVKDIIAPVKNKKAIKRKKLGKYTLDKLEREKAAKLAAIDAKYNIKKRIKL